MKKIGTYIFILILTFSCIFGRAAESLENERVVESAFQKSQANLEEININSHIIANDQFLTIDNANKICNDIAERLNLSEVSQEKYEEEGFSQVITRGIISENLYATIIVQKTEYENFKEGNIVLDIIGTEIEYDLEELCDKIRSVLKNYGEPRMNITLTGSYEGIIDNEELGTRIEKIIKETGIRKVEGIEEENLISITGYSPNMKEYITVGGKKVNLNIAGRYNSYEDKTYIWIGTPVIVMEY